jgi:copper(I)-binding protein
MGTEERSERPDGIRLVVPDEHALDEQVPEAAEPEAKEPEAAEPEAAEPEVSVAVRAPPIGAEFWLDIAKADAAPAEVVQVEAPRVHDAEAHDAEVVQLDQDDEPDRTAVPTTDTVRLLVALQHIMLFLGAPLDWEGAPLHEQLEAAIPPRAVRLRHAWVVDDDCPLCTMLGRTDPRCHFCHGCGVVRVAWPAAEHGV